MPAEERQKAGQEAQALLESNKPQVTVDSYWTYGLTTDSHFILRLHSNELKANQQLLTQLLGTGLGRHLNLEYTVSGVTKSLNYAPDFPELVEKLKAAKYKGDPSTYAIMIPVRKNAEWWNLPKEERVALMKEHTIPTVAYLETVKRKLYHSTGISDVDFLTIFERLGNMDARRDWGHAKEYVKAMWLMLQQEKPNDFVIATGEEHSVKEFAEAAFSSVDLDYRDHVIIDPNFMRPAEIDILLGDASKARERLEWSCNIKFKDLVEEMVQEDLRLLNA